MYNIAVAVVWGIYILRPSLSLVTLSIGPCSYCYKKKADIVTKKKSLLLPTPFGTVIVTKS
jgi:hypothetical protein